MTSILSIGIAGMRAAETRFQGAAAQVARASTASGSGAGADMAETMVAARQASYDFKASAKLVEIGRDMTRQLLDIVA